MLEDSKLREELEKMGLKFERKWWHGALGKPKNFEIWSLECRESLRILKF